MFLPLTQTPSLSKAEDIPDVIGVKISMGSKVEKQKQGEDRERGKPKKGGGGGDLIWDGKMDVRACMYWSIGEGLHWSDNSFGVQVCRGLGDSMLSWGSPVPADLGWR